MSSSYYENKSLAQVCSGLALKPVSIFDNLDKETPATAASIKAKASLALARQMPGPRDLDGRVGEIVVKGA